LGELHGAGLLRYGAATTALTFPRVGAVAARYDRTLMDPSEPSGRPLPPARPTPEPPVWATGGDQAAEGPPGWATGGVPMDPGTTGGGLGARQQLPGEPGWPGWAPPPEPPARRRARAGWVVAVVVALAAVLAAGVLALRPTALRVQPARQPAAAPRQAASAPATADPRAAVPKLLADRARAILRGDRAAFLATVDRRRAGWYRSQAALFARLRTVPFSAVDYRVTDQRNWASATLRRRYAPDRVYLPRLQLRYRFRGQDASPVLGEQSYAFVLTRAGWRIAGQGAARRDDVQIWDAGTVRTRRTDRTLVVYHPGGETLAGRLLAAAERGYGEVAATWTGRWERKVVILVPRDQSEAERLVGVRDLSPVAALSASSVESGPGGRVLGNRIVVNSTVLTPYRDLDLQNVVTHEMTHVATRTIDDVPLFLVEGFADYTALRPFRRYPLTATRLALAAQVRAGRFDGRLPTARDLRGRDGQGAYDEASTFCLWVVERYGEDRLRALYRAFAGSGPGTADELDRGFREVLGMSVRTAEARWAAWVRARL
jgi:hypothetical protein